MKNDDRTPARTGRSPLVNADDLAARIALLDFFDPPPAEPLDRIIPAERWERAARQVRQEWQDYLANPGGVYVPPQAPPAQTNSNTTASAPLTAGSLFSAYREAVGRFLSTSLALPAHVVAPPDGTAPLSQHLFSLPAVMPPRLALLSPDDARTRAVSLLATCGSPPLPSMAELDIDINAAIDGLGSMDAFFDYVQWRRQREQQYRAATPVSVLIRRFRAMRECAIYATAEDRRLDREGDPHWYWGFPEMQGETGEAP